MAARVVADGGADVLGDYVELAQQLSARLNRPLTAPGVRQILHRARAKFGELLLEEVFHSLRYPSAELLEQELIDLGLLPYCRPALQQRGPTK